MTPDDVIAVQRSWADLSDLGDVVRAAFATQLARRAGMAPVGALARAAWLLGAVDELVGLLPSTSRLQGRARDLSGARPPHSPPPSLAMDADAWLAAVAPLAPAWSDALAGSWRGAWLLLTELLAGEILSPFAD